MDNDTNADKRTERLIEKSDTLRTRLESALADLERYANQLERETVRLRKTIEEGQ